MSTKVEDGSNNDATALERSSDGINNKPASSIPKYKSNSSIRSSVNLKNPNTNQTISKQFIYKLLVIGDPCTGKTSFIKRYTSSNLVTTQYKATVGVDFAVKVIKLDDTTTYRLHLWDIAGQERFTNMTRIYYKEAAGALIFFDSSRDLTFKNVDKWKKDLDSKLTLPNNVPVPVILCANKCDLKKFEIIKNGTMDAYCETNGYAGWFETSVKDGIHIEEPIKELIGSIKKSIS